MTKIEWVRNADKSQGKTWNVVTGCSHAGSPGCDKCYARRMARRLAGRHGYPEYPHHFDVTLHPDRLDVPLRRKKPTTFFVVSMGDLFHKNVPPWFVCEVWQVMRECPRHIFQILTKRPKRMLRLIETYIADHEFGIEPLPNVWLGVSCEDQATADERIPLLLQTPAAVRFVSVEPMLGPVDLRNLILNESSDGNHDMLDALNGMAWFKYTCITNPHLAQADNDRIDWVICGSESGPGARPMDEDWVRSLRDQCVAAGILFFYKQNVVDGKKVSCPELDGRQWREMPEV